MRVLASAIKETFRLKLVVAHKPEATPSAEATLPVRQTMKSAAATSTQVSRHDHHNLEFKSVIELGTTAQKVTTEFFVYFPKNFEIDLVGKTDLNKDLRTRLRVAIPSAEGFDDADFVSALAELRKANARLDAEVTAHQAMGMEVPSDVRDGVLEREKDVAAIVAERLKRLSNEHGRQFFLSQSLLATAPSRAIGFENFVRNLQTVRRKIELIRDASRSNCSDGQALNALLDEYVSQLYVRYLGAIGNEFARYESNGDAPKTAEIDIAGMNAKEGSTLDCDAGAATARARARQLLKALQEDEAVYRKNRGLSFESESELEREQHLIRLSQLKKFFQSKTFVEVTKTAAASKVTESSALIGTAIAAIVAAILEQFGRKNVATLASQGLMVVSLGVILYVIRDRMKDWARAKLQEKAMGLIPDYETRLVADQKQFGLSREWLAITTSKKCDAGIVEARYADSVIDRSLRLPEDVMHARRVFYLESHNGGNGQMKTLHENMRFNIDRHLKFMDDPFKDLTDLESDGNLTLSRSHRVYHFHVVTRTMVVEGEAARLSRSRLWINALRVIFGVKAKPDRPKSTQMTAHRVVLDKSGIVRVEPIAL